MAFLFVIVVIVIIFVFMSNDPNSRNERRKRWVLEHPELTVKPSMKRRSPNHDYNGRAFYMVTLCVEGRRPLLGSLCAPDSDHAQPWVRLSELGRQVEQKWLDIPRFHPEIRLLAFQPMPDHIHGILHVTRHMACHLGRVIQGFKKGCYDAFHSNPPAGAELASLWEEGYNDRIIYNAELLDRWFQYLADNPRRLWMKRNTPEFFTRHTGITIGSTPVTTMGNRFLLDYPEKVNVKCSRSLTQSEIEAQCLRFLTMASRGAVLVSPCISPGEKEVMGRAFEAGFPSSSLSKTASHPCKSRAGGSLTPVLMGGCFWSLHGPTITTSAASPGTSATS